MYGKSTVGALYERAQTNPTYMYTITPFKGKQSGFNVHVYNQSHQANYIRT